MHRKSARCQRAQKAQWAGEGVAGEERTEAPSGYQQAKILGKYGFSMKVALVFLMLAHPVVSRGWQGASRGKDDWANEAVVGEYGILKKKGDR